MRAGQIITDMVNRKVIEEVDDKLVSQASDLISDQMLASIAISLKRIADALDGTNGIGIEQAIERAIGTGMFHGFQNFKR